MSHLFSAGSLLSNDTLEELIEGIFILFNQTVFSFLHSDSTESNLNVALLYGVLTLVESIFLRRPLEVFIQSEVARQTLPSIYETTYLVPLLLSESPETAALQKKATYLWKAIENGSGALDEEIIDLVTSDVRRLVENTDSRLPFVPPLFMLSRSLTDEILLCSSARKPSWTPSPKLATFLRRRTSRPASSSWRETHSLLPLQ